MGCKPGLPIPRELHFEVTKLPTMTQNRVTPISSVRRRNWKRQRREVGLAVMLES